MPHANLKNNSITTAHQFRTNAVNVQSRASKFLLLQNGILCGAYSRTNNRFECEEVLKFYDNSALY